VIEGIPIGFRGGFLNGAEIKADFDKIFFPGTVPHPGEQIQQAGIDLTVARIIREPFSQQVSFGSDGWTWLAPSRYWVEFNEIPRGDELDYLFHLWPRSTHPRGGGLLAIGIGKVTGSKDGIMGAAIDINNPHGMWIERNARLAQATIESSTKAFATWHGPNAHSRPLTVEKIFRFKSESRLGTVVRHVETEEVEEGKVRLGSREGYLVRFVETIKVAPDELVTSLKDNPYQFMFAMGAVADPGYSGKLHACVTSFKPYEIFVGMPLLQFRRDKITPVSNNKLYKGEYQGLGADDDSEPTLIWYHPADIRARLQARNLAPQ